MTLNDTTGHSEAEVEFTPGEAAIYELLEQLGEKVEELTEKVNNLNLSYNEGYSIES